MCEAVLGIEHHLLIGPLCSKLCIGRIKVGRLWVLIRLLWLLLLVILIKGGIERRRRYVGSPAALRLLLDRV